MKISYECEELIEELESDIKEFGNIDMYAFFDEVNGYTFLTNYDFIDDEIKLKTEEIGKSIVQILKAEKILEILKKQNEILGSN